MSREDTTEAEMDYLADKQDRWKLRERCEIAWNIWKADKKLFNAPNDVIAGIITERVEAFAREMIEADRKVRDNQIRNEALEEAATGLEKASKFMFDPGFAASIVRGFKDPDALAAVVSEDK